MLLVWVVGDSKVERMARRSLRARATWAEMESHGGLKQRLIYKRAVARARLSRGSREGVDGVQQNKVQRVDASRPNKDNASV